MLLIAAANQSACFNLSTANYSRKLHKKHSIRAVAHGIRRGKVAFANPGAVLRYYVSQTFLATFRSDLDLLQVNNRSDQKKVQISPKVRRSEGPKKVQISPKVRRSEEGPDQTKGQKVQRRSRSVRRSEGPKKVQIRPKVRRSKEGPDQTETFTARDSRKRPFYDLQYLQHSPRYRPLKSFGFQKQGIRRFH